MVHAARMAASASRIEISRARLMAAIDDYAAAVRTAAGSSLGEGLIHTREARDRLEAVFAEGLRRFDQSGEYAADGAIDLVAWLRSRCKLSGNAAAERVGIARQLEHLPQTDKAFASGQLAYQHVAVMARTAEHVGAAVVRKAEGSLLALADTMDPGQFTGVAKTFEHRVDAQAALAEANRAHQRRYLTISEPLDGIVRLDGLLDAEAGAIVRNAVRDRGCVAEHCTRPPQWTDTHHVKHWIDQGPTTMTNLILLCRPHHRKVHEEGWGLQRLTTGRWALIRPVAARSRSA